MSNKTQKVDAEKTGSGLSHKKKLLLVFIFSILTLVILVNLYPVLQGNCLRKSLSFQCIAKLEVEKDDITREKGLSGREGLNKDEGMLFAFDEPGIHCFWMKDMKFSIDIIWLDADKKVVKVLDNVSPLTYPEQFCPETSDQYVIELDAGQAAISGIDVGQKYSFRVE